MRMAIPDYQAVMLPFLELAGDGQEHAMREAIKTLGEHFRLSETEQRQLLPSGRQSAFDNRVGWARTYLKKAGLIEYTRRAHFRITQLGLSVLATKPAKIDVAFLEQFPDFVEFRIKNKEGQDNQPILVAEREDITPEEAMEAAYVRVRQSLASELLQVVKENSPSFFEQLVVDLLLKMGYGGTRKDAGEAIGGSGDGGIDGIIKEDRLGLDIVYIQAKRWDVVVSRPEIQKFAGALQGQRAKKGIFITTSSFSETAKEYVKFIDSKIVLIDGVMLAELMIDYGVGVTTAASYEVKRIDSDYFGND
jgi:restriction system protein